MTSEMVKKVYGLRNRDTLNIHQTRLNSKSEVPKEDVRQIILQQEIADRVNQRKAGVVGGNYRRYVISIMDP